MQLDVLIELPFQEEHTNITSIDMQLDVLIKLLRRRFLRYMFGVGTQYVSYFLKISKHGKLDFINNTSASHVHMLIFELISNSLTSSTMEYCV
jgi:hypothetical protein